MDLRHDERIPELERDGLEQYSRQVQPRDLATTIYNLFAHIALEAINSVQRRPGA